MTVADAMRLLGLSTDATRFEIDEAHMAKIRQAHPDGSRPDEALARSLNVARDIALGALGGTTPPGSGLVRISDVAALVQLVADVPAERRERRDNAREQVAQVVLLHRGRIQALRRRQFAIAFMTGGIAALGALVGALTKFDFKYDDMDAVSLAAHYVAWFPVVGVVGLLGAMLALSAFLTKSRIEWLERSIEEAATALGDRQTLVRTVRELGLTSSWTSDDLQNAVQRWTGDKAVGPQYRWGSSLLEAFPRRQSASIPLRDAAALVGSVDFTRMLLAKGTESGVLREEHAEADDGILEYRFRLARPSDETA